MLVTQQGDPRLTPVNRIMEPMLRWISREGRGRTFGQWMGGTSIWELRHLGKAGEEIPWTPLRRPLAEATVALVTSSGVHLRTDRPFDFGLKTDASFRVIPGSAEPADLQITHQGYDRRDAARDINLVFPLPRLRELAAEGIVGRVSDEHFGFGLAGKGADLLAPGREVGRRLARAGVDLALLVPA